MATTVRSADPADAPAIRFVAQESWHAAYDDILGPETVEATVDEWYDLAELRRTIAADEGDVSVATTDADTSDATAEPAANAAGDVVGFAHVAPGEEPSVAHLVRIYVRPPFWGRGIGRTLLERCERSLASDGYDRLTLEVFAANEVGVSFYESTGFDRAETREETFAGESHRVAVYEKEL